MALTEILGELLPEKNLFLFHCSYGLRGKENEEEKKFFKEITREKNLKSYFYFHDLTNYPHNIQNKAREIRYQQARKLVKENGFDYIVTGHHLDDFLETFFLKLLAGSSPETVVKMLAFKRRDVIRPLLPYRKEQIQAFMHQRKLKFLKDSSNDSNHYQRNFLRNRVFKDLDERFVDWRSNVLRFCDYLEIFNQMKQDRITEKWAVVKSGFLFLKDAFFGLDAKFRITILHQGLSELYPQKRFSKNFFASINQKINHR